MKKIIVRRSVALVLLLSGASGVWGGPEVPGADSSEAPPAWPDTFAAHRARAFFLAVEAETDEPMQAWQKANRSAESLAETPLEQRVARGRSITQQAGKLRIGKVADDGNYVADVFAHSEKYNLWLKFHFVFDSQDPHYLVSMQGTPSSPPDAVPAVLTQASNLTEVLERIQKQSGLPAFAAAIVEGDRIVDVAAAGVRRWNQSEAVTKDDRFHIGSVGKAMTATMIAQLVENQTLRWNLTLGEALPGVAMRAEYKAVTLEDLLQHRGGLPPYTDDESMSASATVKAAGSPTGQRAAFAAQVLNETPATPPGTIMLYSNAGYALAAHVAERAAKKPWEELMKSLLFDRLGMTRTGVGWPATTDRPGQPHGHFGNPPDLRVQAIGEYDLGAYLAPAGDIHCSMEDMARFAMSHMQGLQGKDGLLKSEMVRKLHTPGGKEKVGYACGWSVEDGPSGTPRHWHDGSAGTFFTSIVLLPERNLAVVASCNAGPAAKVYADQIVEWVLQRPKTEAPPPGR